VQRLTAEEDTSDLPPEYVLDNGESSFARPGAALYATPRQVAGEHALRRAAVRRGAAAFTAQEAAAVVARFAMSGHELGADQARVVRGVLSSGADVEVVAAAAGTGKRSRSVRYGRCGRSPGAGCSGSPRARSPRTC